MNIMDAMQEGPSSPKREKRLLPNPERLRPALMTGVYVGALLILVMSAALAAANRVPALERYALERNAASYGTFVILLLIPVVRFLKRPLHLFVSAIVAWVLFVGAYNIAGFYFRDLFDMRTPFQALIEGGVLYGVIAVTIWVMRMALYARRHAIAPGRRRVHDVVHHHR
jgi:hypothetical protein